MRKDVAFASQQFELSERRACKLLGLDRGTYRYEPRPDRNVPLREALITLARQKPRYGYRRLHALLVRRDYPASVMRTFRLYRAEGLAVRRLRRDECLNANWFRNRMDARAKITAWRDEYNGERPHSSLGYRTPNEFAEILKSSVMTG
jgi:putative transposase